MKNIKLKIKTLKVIATKKQAFLRKDLRKCCLESNGSWEFFNIIWVCQTKL